MQHGNLVSSENKTSYHNVNDIIVNPIVTSENFSTAISEDIYTCGESIKTFDFNDFQNVNMEHLDNKKQDNFSWIVDDTSVEGNAIVSELKVSI
jgi:hypothetical protein